MLPLILTALLTVNSFLTQPALATYGDYSQMTTRSAGQYRDAAGQVAGQWAWTPDGATSRISWGDPANWPPPTYEQFEHVGDWVLLDGYGATTTGEFLPQQIDREQVSDGACRNPTPLPAADGRQHYARWITPTAPYCLEAWGHMIYQGARIDFSHKQIWTPGLSCANRYYPVPRPCLRQYEEWRDNLTDPGGPLMERQRRDNYLALGIGPGFIVADYRTGWRAELSANWRW